MMSFLLAKSQGGTQHHMANEKQHAQLCISSVVSPSSNTATNGNFSLMLLVNLNHFPQAPPVKITAKLCFYLVNIS